MLTDEEKKELMQVVYACAATGILRESLNMINKSLKLAFIGSETESEYANFVSDELNKLAHQYHEKITII